jgi:hypothetical protein
MGPSLSKILRRPQVRPKKMMMKNKTGRDLSAGLLAWNP